MGGGVVGRGASDTRAGPAGTAANAQAVSSPTSLHGHTPSI